MSTAEPQTLLDAGPLALLYHENSKLNAASQHAVGAAVSEFANDAFEVRRSITGAKTYPGGDRIDLSAPSRTIPCRETLEGALARRRSVRQSAQDSISLAVIAALLERAAGVTGELPAGNGLTQLVRAFPSGGALYPAETYVCALQTTDIPAGIYHYHAPSHCLETVRTGDFGQQVRDALVAETEATAPAPALIVFSGRWERTLAKYGDRGYRILLLEIGHLAQNILLTAAALGLAACPIAAFDEDRLGSLMGLDPAAEPVFYAVEIGYPDLRAY